MVDGAGASVLTGTFHYNVDFGAGPHVSGSGVSGDSYLAKFDADGQVLWSKSFGEGAIARVTDAAVDALGNVVVTGTLNGSKDFGTGIVTSNKVDLLVARYDPMGAPLSAKVYGGAGDQYAGWLVVDSSGSAIVTGVLGFGGSVLVHKTNSAGNVLWAKVWGGLSAMPRRLAVDAADNIVLTGIYGTTIDFGNGELTATPGGGDDTFAVKLSPAGTALWSRTYPLSSPVSVAVDAMGHIFLTGQLGGSVDFGGGALVSAGSGDVVLAKFGQ